MDSELVVMSRREIERAHVMRAIQERRLTQKQAASQLSLSVRQVERLFARYKRDGPTGLVSRRRGQRNHVLPDGLREEALRIVRMRYPDFGPTLAHEKLFEVHGFRMSVETLRKWMSEDGIWLTRRQRKKRIQQPRHRRDCYVELVQIDGSDHHWFEDRGPRCVLLVYVDDATGKLMALRMCESESAFSYFHATRSYLERHGKPVAFYSDKAGVFRVNAKRPKAGDGFTQFGRAMSELNIDVICANTPAAKGRVERAHQTLQDRLVKGLRLRGISTMEDANAYLPEFMEEYNRRFARAARSDHDTHRPLLQRDCLDDIFTWQEERRVTAQLTVHHKRTMYLLEPTPAPWSPFGSGHVCLAQLPDTNVRFRHLCAAGVDREELLRPPMSKPAIVTVAYAATVAPAWAQTQNMHVIVLESRLKSRDRRWHEKCSISLRGRRLMFQRLPTSGTYYERFSALDASILGFEERNAHWHEAAVLVFDAGPLRTEDGGLDFDKILNNYEWSFESVPRYRQRISEIPFFDHPVWVDDPSFNVRYHIRQIALPQPADERILKRVCGYLLELPLDIDKPPWEVWVVDGLQNDRFALVAKIHHCMADGISGVSIIRKLLGRRPFEREGEPEPWTPRPAPGGAELATAEIVRRIRAPFELLAPLRQPNEALQGARDVVRGLLEASRLGWRPASNTPFNPESIGPHRRFDWTEISLNEVKAVRAGLGGTVNDVVLATAAGAFGHFLREHRTVTTDIDFRVLIPVSLRGDKEKELGNRVAMIMAELPVGEGDPARRLQRVIETTQKLKQSKQAVGVSWLEDLADKIGGRFFGELSRSATRNRPFNVAVTNVPGPQVPLYFLGSKLLAIYPMMPLFPNQALSVAVLSYNDDVFWGFNSDWDSLPDVHNVVEGIGAHFGALRAAARETAPAVATL